MLLRCVPSNASQVTWQPQHMLGDARWHCLMHGDKELLLPSFDLQGLGRKPRAGAADPLPGRRGLSWPHVTFKARAPASTGRSCRWRSPASRSLHALVAAGILAHVGLSEALALCCDAAWFPANAAA